jgi:hypothetical protein
MTTETRPALRYPGFVDLIDISSVQVITDAKAVVEDGFVGATVKASEGSCIAILGRSRTSSGCETSA